MPKPSVLFLASTSEGYYCNQSLTEYPSNLFKMSKLLTVFGATGNQGGSVTRAMLKDASLMKEFKIRGITRDISKPAAEALISEGIEMKSVSSQSVMIVSRVEPKVANRTQADMGSKSSLVEAIKGSHTVFLVTTPDFMSGQPSQELIHGKNVADVALEAGVQHLIFSSLLHVTEATNGRLKHVLHFDLKADVERYIRSIGLPSTFIFPGYFMSNFTALQMLKKGEDGVYTLAYPFTEKAEFPLIDTESDIGGL